MSNEKLTIEDIARDLGISKTTVSRAISGKGRIGKDTVERVNAYIEEHNYHPNAIAKSLASSKSYNIAFVMNGDYGNTDLPFFQKCLWGVNGYVAPKGYDVVICIVLNGDISQLKRLVNDRKIDGAVISRTIEGDKSQEFLASRGIPFVTIGSVTDKDAVQIDNNHEKGCEELTGYLYRMGYKRPVLLGGNEEYIVNSNRKKGFLEAGKKAGIKQPDAYVEMNLENNEDTKKALKKALKNDADCIVCMDDVICAEVLHILDKKGIDIPDKVGVASFYDSTVLENHTPSVTALCVDIAELGKVSGERLISMLENEDNYPQKTLLGYEIKVRKSTK